MVDVPGAEVKADLDACMKELAQTEAVSEKMKLQLERAMDRIHFLRGKCDALRKYVKPEASQEVAKGAQPEG